MQFHFENLRPEIRSLKNFTGRRGRSHDNLLMQFGGHFVSEKRKAIWWANQYFSAAAAAKKEETVELWKPRKNHAAADRRPSIQCHATHRIKRKSARRVFDSVKGKKSFNFKNKFTTGTGERRITICSFID